MSYYSMASGSAAPEDNYERVRRHLLLMAHAEKCRRLRYVHRDMRCTVLYCNVFQGILNHMNECPNLNDCQMMHCTASRRIMTHYKVCKRLPDFCPVCDLLKFTVQTNPGLFPEDLFDAYAMSLQ